MRNEYILHFFLSALLLFVHVQLIQSLNFQEQNLIKVDTTFRIIPSENHTYGYEILVQEKLLIYQPNIPGISGNKGFTHKSDAEKVAKLVIKKLHQGIMPPTVYKIELDSLKIKF